MVTLFWLVAGCAAPPAPPPTMEAQRALTRVSLDLRGRRPEPAELAVVAADPTAVERYTQLWLQGPALGERVRDLWSEVYLTRADGWPVDSSQYGRRSIADFEESVGEEDLRILEWVTAHDLPWTDVVTADWTVANETLTSVWPLEWVEGAPEEGAWARARYTDGRPAAGVLSTNSLWWRYGSANANANRHRANAVSRILLCDDYLARPIEFDRNVNLLDGAAVEDAVRNNPNCVTCHASLDPIASYLFGFWWYISFSPAEVSYYQPSRELMWQEYLGVPPAWYGVPGYGLQDLGQQIAGDPRFPNCATQQAFELLLRRDATYEDTEALAEHRDAFIAGGLTMRALLGSVVRDPAYLSPDTDEAGFVPRKMVTADLLAAQTTALTGFVWTDGYTDYMDSSFYGFHTLAGGADGDSVTATATDPNTTLVLVQQRLAEAAASHAVESGAAPVLAGLDLDTRPSEAELATLTQAVVSRAVPPTDTEVAELLELWDAAAAEGGAREAWATVLTVLLRDPDYLFY